MMRKLLLALALLPVVALANTAVQVDTAPINSRDKISLQRGVNHFVNYCLSCHSANFMRYGRLQDLGLSEEQIKTYLLPSGAKIGDAMSITLLPQDAKTWFGKAPPDLSVIARARGVDWLYSYLRGFYRDDSKASGWNNTVFPDVGMPHVLYELQGEQVLHHEAEKGEHAAHSAKLMLEKSGKLTPLEYDEFVADLVNYLDYMGEPSKGKRVLTGILVLFFLALLLPLTILIKKEYWKDVK
ncbi:MAG: cytochrome c1 [Burkholderiales bacterium]